jgi:peptide-methionine (R)-S-oxide reductase
MKSITFILAFLAFASCNQAQPQRAAASSAVVNTAGDTLARIAKSEDAWKSELTDMQYYVLRQAGTERAFTGHLLNNKKKGVYTCAGCGLPLFSSDTKYDSGSGWPSYYKPIDRAHVEEREDRSHGWNRVEVLCARCGGHLGHVFDDGPKPTGLRYCINSAALGFEE